MAAQKSIIEILISEVSLSLRRESGRYKKVLIKKNELPNSCICNTGGQGPSLDIPRGCMDIRSWLVACSPVLITLLLANYKDGSCTTN